MTTQKYDIGYGKPPLATRFKSGQSGNPKGRPKGSKNLKTVVQQEMSGPIVINEGGRQKRVSRREALIKMMLNKALKGDLKASREVILLDRLIDQDIPQVTMDDSLGNEDLAILEDFRTRLVPAKSIHSDSECGDES